MDDKILINIKPKYNISLYLIFIFIIFLFISLFFIKNYDVYETKAYLTCDDKCYIIINNELYLNNIEYVSINSYKYKVISVEYDSYDNNIVKLEVDQLDYGEKTYQDIKIFYNMNALINKIMKGII